MPANLWHSLVALQKLSETYGVTKKTSDALTPSRQPNFQMLSYQKVLRLAPSEIWKTTRLLQSKLSATP
jgi:hypothetical protein